MHRSSKTFGLFFVLLAICLFGLPAQAEHAEDSGTVVPAETGTYVFLSDQSTVVQTGGIAGVHETYPIVGQFRLSVDFDARTASFSQVDANLLHESPFLPTQSLGELFNMTELVGSVVDDMIIDFAGQTTDATDTDILLRLTFTVDLVRITGQTIPPPNSADFFYYNLDAVAWRKYGGGTGEPNDPYLICTAEQMNAIGANENDWDKHFKLMADIDLSGYARTAFNIIGHWRDRSDSKPFTGVFDGDGHVISNFTYTSTEVGKIGLFGYINGENAQIKNLGLIEPDVNGGAGRYVAALVSDSNGCITGCYVQGGSISGNHNVGGVTGYNRGRITNCTFSSTVSGTGWVVGGLAGNNYGTIINCYSSGDVSGGGNVGGLVGTNDGTIAECYATSNIWGNDGVGGLVGHNDYYANIVRCHSTAAVSGDSALGGLVGSNSGRIIDSYSAGAVSGDKWVGGLVGISGSYFGEAFGTITNCYSVGSISIHTTAGGLLGFNYGTVTASFWDIETSARTNMCGRQIWGTGCNNANGKTTAEMQMQSTFTNVGWDFVRESENGTEDIWWILEGQDYPRLTWELVERGAVALALKIDYCSR